MKTGTKTLLAAAVICFLIAGGCSETPEPEPITEQQPEPVSEPVQPEPEPTAPNEPTAPQPPPPSTSHETSGGEPVWADGKGHGWILVRGLDDGDYENYYPSMVRKVQNALQSQGLYSGPISGVLDEATMNAIGEYQRAENLQIVGVPTPRTRKALAIPPRDPQER